MTTKQQFLLDHNKLSPMNLQASVDILTRFKKDKPALFVNNTWSTDKMRRPFLIWLTSLTKADRKELKMSNRVVKGDV